MPQRCPYSAYTCLRSLSHCAWVMTLRMLEYQHGDGTSSISSRRRISSLMSFSVCVWPVALRRWHVTADACLEAGAVIFHVTEQRQRAQGIASRPVRVSLRG